MESGQKHLSNAFFVYFEFLFFIHMEDVKMDRVSISQPTLNQEVNIVSFVSSSSFKSGLCEILGEETWAQHHQLFFCIEIGGSPVINSYFASMSLETTFDDSNAVYSTF
jgi:hypothetical protein